MRLWKDLNPVFPVRFPTKSHNYPLFVTMHNKKGTTACQADPKSKFLLKHNNLGDIPKLIARCLREKKSIQLDSAYS